VAWPWSAEYWHMGAITMRLGKVSGPEGALKVKGVKSRLMLASVVEEAGQLNVCQCEERSDAAVHGSLRSSR
jgi:hypothetical protein